MDKEFIKHKNLGFGSSDAAEIIKYAKSGVYSNKLLERIAVIKGERERKEIYSPFFWLGDQVENDYYNLMVDFFGDGVQNNPTTHSPIESQHFTTYCHIDIIQDGVWKEVKATKDDFNTTKAKYAAQLAWHKMIMQDNGIEDDLMLVVYDTSNIYLNPKELYSFNPDKLSSEIVTDEELASDIELIKSGLQLLDYNWDTIPAYAELDVVEYTDEDLETNQALSDLKGYLDEVAVLNAYIAEKKAEIYEGMRDNGIKTISFPGYTLIAKEDSVRSSFDSSKFKKSHPDLFGEFQKSSKVKGSLTIRSKK